MTHSDPDNSVTTADTKAHDFVPVIPLSTFVEKQYLKLGEADTGMHHIKTFDIECLSETKYILIQRKKRRLKYYPCHASCLTHPRTIYTNNTILLLQLQSIHTKLDFVLTLLELYFTEMEQ